MQAAVDRNGPGNEVFMELQGAACTVAERLGCVMARHGRQGLQGSAPGRGNRQRGALPDIDADGGDKLVVDTGWLGRVCVPALDEKAMTQCYGFGDQIGGSEGFCSRELGLANPAQADEFEHKRAGPRSGAGICGALATDRRERAGHAQPATRPLTCPATGTSAVRPHR